MHMNDYIYHLLQYSRTLYAVLMVCLCASYDSHQKKVISLNKINQLYFALENVHYIRYKLNV
jgi:hypothetical protein